MQVKSLKKNIAINYLLHLKEHWELEDRSDFMAAILRALEA